MPVVRVEDKHLDTRLSYGGLPCCSTSPSMRSVSV
jgi:hypothetical protein